MKVNFFFDSNRKQNPPAPVNLDKFGWKLLVFSPPRAVAYINLISASGNLWSSCLGPNNLHMACGPHKPITKKNYEPSSDAFAGKPQRGPWRGHRLQGESRQKQTWTPTWPGNKVGLGFSGTPTPCLRPSNCLFLPLGPLCSILSHSYSRPWSETLNRYAKCSLNVDNWNINVPPLCY